MVWEALRCFLHNEERVCKTAGSVRDAILFRHYFVLLPRLAEVSRHPLAYALVFVFLFNGLVSVIMSS